MIEIKERLRPFSHLPGTRCLIPGTEYIVEAFPALIRIYEKEELVKVLPLEIEGPLKQFTVMQDLERGCVVVFSERYHFQILPDLEIVTTKHPHLPPLSNQERLSLGSHKKQDWNEIKKRGDFRDIFPLWFRLGSLLNLIPRAIPEEGIFSLIEEGKQALLAHQPEKLVPIFQKLYLAGFESLMVPRIKDTDYQGIVPLGPLPQSSPLYLLTEGAILIRSMFLLSSGNEIAILPNLPPEFFAGRMLHLKCAPYGELDLEWTKKMVRRVEFRAKQDGEIQFYFHPSIKTFRVRESKKDRGHHVTAGQPLAIKSGCSYLLDRFQK